MAIATTTALLIGAGIAAGTQVYGAQKASQASKEATKAQTASSDEALRYAREQEAIRRADYERALAEWQAGRNTLLQRYGVSVPELSTPRAPLTTTPASQPGAVPRATVGNSNLLRTAPTLAALMSQGERQASPYDPYNKWNDWESYGLPSA